MLLLYIRGYPKESCTFVPSLRSCAISGVTLGSLQPHTFDGLRHVVITIYRTYTIPALKVFGRRTFDAEFRRSRSNVSKVQMGVGWGVEHRKKGCLGSILFTCQKGKHNINDRKISTRSRF
jgi:hypothetical protein